MMNDSDFYQLRREVFTAVGELINKYIDGKDGAMAMALIVRGVLTVARGLMDDPERFPQMIDQTVKFIVDQAKEEEKNEG